LHGCALHPSIHPSINLAALHELPPAPAQFFDSLMHVDTYIPRLYERFLNATSMSFLHCMARILAKPVVAGDYAVFPFTLFVNLVPRGQVVHQTTMDVRHKFDLLSSGSSISYERTKNTLISLLT
jgi:hypothetical protein